MRIDAHQHFWRFDPVRDSWITDEMAVIQKDFYPSDLQPNLLSNKIEGCVSVQADQSEAETLFLLDLAKHNMFIKGVVGWVDLRSTQVEERLEYFSSLEKFKGVRHIVQGEPDDNFLLRDEFRRGIGKLKSYDLTYDILIYPKQLDAAVKFVPSFPNQKFVIDHIAKPFICEGRLDNWKNQIIALSKFDNVFCKVSGMVTEAKWKGWKYEDFVPYLDVVFNSFGSKRIMYGSDWPVCLVAGSYDDQFSIVKKYISKLSAVEQADVLGNTAIKFYNL